MPKITINTAPINIISPAVENRPTPDFSESAPKDRLTKNAEIIENIHSIAKTVKIPAINGIMLSIDIFEGLGVRPERAVQSPFQSGKIVYRKSVSEVRTTIITAAIEITPPTIPIINP